MNAKPDHEELQEMLPEAALEILERTDLQRVLAHTRDCAECAQLLGEYQEVAAALALQLPPQEADPDRLAVIRARLLSRARGDLRARAADPEVATVPRSRRTAAIADRWMGWTVAAALAGVLLMHHAIHQPVQYGWLVAGAVTLVLVAVAVYARVQRGRVSALQRQIDVLEQETMLRDERVEP